MRRILKACLLALTPLMALLGCDAARVAQLRPGVSTEADVRALFGQPDEVFQLPDGAQQLDFSRQPEGTTCYMITIAANGQLRSVVQALQPATFERVRPGLTQAEVRQLLGRPATQQHFDLKNEDLWEWRWQDAGQNKLFGVTFDAAGRVRATSVSEDMRNRH